MASMILGQDGIWGDLTAISPEGLRTIAGLISRYKRVRNDMASADPVVTGVVSSSPEVHEKIAANGRGAVVLFATVPGTYEYTTQHTVSSEHWSSNETTIRTLGNGHAHLTAEFTEPGARIIFFGIGNRSPLPALRLFGLYGHRQGIVLKATVAGNPPSI